MRKGLPLVLALLLMVFPAAADLESTIAEACPSKHEPLVSMAHPNKTYNNIGHPATYKYKVCVKGLTESRFDTSCTGSTGFYVSSNKTSAHFSEREGYKLHVCTGNVRTEVKSNGCSDSQTALFNVSSEINGYGRHIAGTSKDSPFSKTVCGTLTRPQNVTLEMKFNLSSSDEVYFDEEKKGEFEYTGLAEFPYLVATDGNHVAGIVSKNFLKVERKINGRNVLKMRKQAEEGSFLIPFTDGTEENIEDNQDLVLDSEFTNQLSPSFGFFIPDEPTVRALLDPDVEIESSLSIGEGTYQIKIKNIGENKVRITEE